MDNENISYQLGKMIYQCYKQPEKLDLYFCTLNLIKELKNKLDIEIIIEGIEDLWYVFEVVEIDNDDIIAMLEKFKLKRN